MKRLVLVLLCCALYGNAWSEDAPDKGSEYLPRYQFIKDIGSIETDQMKLPFYGILLDRETGKSWVLAVDTENKFMYVPIPFWVKNGVTKGMP